MRTPQQQADAYRFAFVAGALGLLLASLIASAQALGYLPTK